MPDPGDLAKLLIIQGRNIRLQQATCLNRLAETDYPGARKVEEIEELRELSGTDPVEMVVHLLQSHGGSMSIDALEKELSGTVVGEAEFKKWWDGTKKALRQSRRVVRIVAA